LGAKDGLTTTVILRTTDGGLNWTRQYTAPIDLSGLAAPDAQHAWVTGDHGTILRTSDGGQTWLTQTVPITITTQDAGLKVTAVDANTAWAIANPQGQAGSHFYVLHTADGGAHWAIQADIQIGFGLASWIDAADPQNVWIGGGHTASLAAQSEAADKGGFIYHSTDGGQTWRLELETPSAPVNQVIIGVDAVDANVAWAAGREGVYRTVNGGDQWEYSHSWGGAADANHVSSVNGGRQVWVSGDNFTVQYTDQGLTPNLADIAWQNRTPLDIGRKVAFKVDFMDAQNGWIAGGDFGGDPGGVVAYTCNGGLSWGWQTWQDLSPIWQVAMVPNKP
jgi:photosystem II stability/assembly factor-like uncharacterized protein